MIHKLAAQLRVAKSKADAGGLPFWRQIFEMAYLFVRNGLGPGYYLMARFWRRDLPLSTKRQHWNGRRYLRFVHKINDPRYYKVSQNKLVEKSLLATLGLPTSKLLGLYHPKAGQGVDGEPLCNATDLERVLATSTADGLFFKPAEGDSGRGVFGLAIVNEAGRRVLREVLTHEEVALAVLAQRLDAAPEGYVIEEMIQQHPVLASINPSSVNTLRIWVVNDSSGVHVAGAFLRAGRAGSLVDNTAAGGLACAIDLDSGVIREALDLTPSRHEYLTHPDSGVELVGLHIPHWRECQRLACEATRILPGATFTGMDIALSPQGPLVVEYNVEPSYQGAAHFDEPTEIVFQNIINAFKHGCCPRSRKDRSACDCINCF